MHKMKILYAEDESALAMILKESLEQRDFEVVWVADGEKAIEQFNSTEFDVIVLDVMMPKMDGFAVAKFIRQTNKRVPLLFLTAKSQTKDVVEGFEIGGDDYLRKPFSMEELIVRLRALHQRGAKQHVAEFRVGFFELNKQSQQLISPQQTFLLTHREMALLELLIKHKNDVLDRSYMLQQIWGQDDFFAGRSMDVFITKLRKKLSLDARIQIINIRGRGYKLID